MILHRWYSVWKYISSGHEYHIFTWIFGLESFFWIIVLFLFWRSSLNNVVYKNLEYSRPTFIHNNFISWLTSDGAFLLKLFAISSLVLIKCKQYKALKNWLLQEILATTSKIIECKIPLHANKSWLTVYMY